MVRVKVYIESKLNQNLLPKTADDKNGEPAFIRPEAYKPPKKILKL